ncbi:recombinase family protein [Streptomyces sp. NPDC002088]|uniref:recombinase family protein n=1 Tax=Streptomyces sp. NPDC002088 TaxID=3154665 RepID=UPI00331CDA71
MQQHDACVEYADLYLRLSLDRDGKTAIERQEADCRAWAGSHGLLVRKVHADRGRSGYKEVSREGFDAARAAVTSGAVRTLIVWKMDRLSRKGIAEVGPLLDEFDNVGGRLVSVMDELDSRSPGARLAIASLSEWARVESETQGERIRHAKQYLRSRGKWIGGSPPYGLCVDPDSGRLTPDAETSVYARLIADEALAGSPLVRIARLLNENGVPSPRGGLWQVGSLSQLLKAPAFAGLLPETETVWDEERGRRKYTGVVKPYQDSATGSPVVVGEGIVTVEERKQIIAALESRTRLRGNGEKYPVRASAHLLTGLLYCGIDGCGMRMSMNGESYVCQGVRLGHTCPGARALAAPVERAVVEAFIDRISSLPAGHPTRKAMADQDVPFDRADLTALWRRSDVGTRRGLLSAAIERVSVARAEGRGRRFDPERRLGIIWAGEGRAE